MARGNRANRDAFISIPAEAKEMLRHIHPAIQQMPKGERIDGVGAEMRRAAYGIIQEYYKAYYTSDAQIKAAHIREMVGWYGHLQAAVELACLFGVLRERFKLPIAERMERIEEGIMKWNNTQSARRQEPAKAPQERTSAARPVSDSG